VDYIESEHSLHAEPLLHKRSDLFYLRGLYAYCRGEQQAGLVFH
jgi:hypothetical protein